MPPLGPVSVVDLFPHERESLLTMLGALSAAQWATATVCPGWTVHDVALHLLGDDVGILSGRRDGYTDRHATAGVDFTRWDQLLAFIDRRNDEWIRATRRISPRLLCELLQITGEATYRYFAQIDPSAPAGPIDWAGPDPAPEWLHTAREYTERWMHQQHIRDAVGQPGLKERRWFAPVLNAFMRALPHTLRTVTSPTGTSLRVVITGDAGGEWCAVRRDGRWLLTADALSSPDAIVILDQETAWRLFTRGPVTPSAMRAIVQEGDASLTSRVLDMVSILA